MRVLCVSNTAWSVFHFRRELLLALQSMGHTITVIAPVDDYSDRLISLGFALVPITLDARGINPLQDWRLICRLRRLYRQIKPALLLHYTIKPVIYGSLASRNLPCYTINTITGLGNAFLGSSLLQRLVGWLYRLSQRQADRVFFQNQHDMALFQQHHWVRDSQCGYVPGSGIDTDYFRPMPLPDGPFTFLLIGRRVWDKGIGEYIAAIRQLNEQLHGCRFALLGKAVDGGRGAIPSDDIDNWVKLGLIEDWGETDDVRSAIARAHCVVLPSYREGLSRSLLEAAAMQRPSITSDVPGCQDVVADGKTGLLCAVKDSYSLAQAMATLFKLPLSARLAMGECARQRIKAQFSSQMVIQAYLQCLSDI